MKGSQMASDLESLQPKTPRTPGQLNAYTSRRFLCQAICAAVTLFLASVLVFHTILSGQLSDNKVVLQSRQGTEIHVLTVGAIIQRILVPDKDGKLGDVALGFDDFEPYKDGTSPYFGAVVGRVANRIANGTFLLEGKRYNVSINEPPNSLHGGIKGWNRHQWKVLRHGGFGNGGQYVKLGLSSPNGDEGYPGTVHASVTYMLSEASTLTIRFEATSDAPSPINMGQHNYFNLDGVEASGTVLDHIVQINSSYVTPVDDVRIPTGEYLSVHKSVYDFAEPTSIGKRVSQVPGPLPVGYDINYVLWGRNQKEVEEHTRHCRAQPKPHLAVSVFSEKSGRRLEVFTDSPGLQFYSGQMLDGVVGKGQITYTQYGGFAVETQMFPNFINEPGFPDCIVRPGEKYVTTEIWKFSVDK